MKKTASLTLENGVKVIGTYLGNKAWPCDSQNKNNHRIQMMSVKKGVHESFEYWSSIADGVTKDESEHLKNAINCILSDAECSLNGFDAFCENLGLSNDSIEDLNAFKECKKTASKLRKLGFTKKSILSYAEKYRD